MTGIEGCHAPFAHCPRSGGDNCRNPAYPKGWQKPTCRSRRLRWHEEDDIIEHHDIIVDNVGIREIVPMHNGTARRLSKYTGRRLVTSTCEKLSFLEEHNYWRARVEPPATNMAQLVWDQQLEEIAKEHAEACKWEPNADRHTKYSTSGSSSSVGENLAFGTVMNNAQAVKNWIAEQDGYDFETDTCSIGSCKHYKQAHTQLG
jgi:uncharacterized protein YkwD